MTCSAASTLKPQASIPLPSVPGLTIGQQQALKLWGQQILSQIQAAAGVTGVNVIPQQYALLAGSSLPPISSTSNCTVSLDTSTVLFGAGSYKVTISGTPATVTLSVDTAWPLHLGWQWLVSFFQQASAAVSGQLTITTPTKAYSTAFTTTTSASGWERLYDTLNLGADTSSSFGLSFTFTGGTGQTVWLDGLMMEPYFGLAIQPSPFISTSGPLLLDNNPDGDYSKILSTHTSGNVAYNYKGVWSSATAYVVGDEVIYGQSYWLALAPSTNSAPATSNASWQVVGSYSGYQGAWSSTTAYIAGAEVTYNGNYWVCVTANTNSAPTTSNANWQIAGPATLQDLADGTSRFAVTNIAGGNAVSSVDGSNRALIDFSQTGHLNRNQDNIPSGTTYGQIKLASLTSGSVDLALTGVLNRNLGNIADSAGRYAVINAGSLNGVSSVDGSNRALIDFSQSGHLNKTLANVPDGTGRYAVTNAGSMNGVASVDPNNLALIDFSQSGHLNKNLANIADGAARFAVVNAGSLNGVSSVDGSNRALIDFSQSGHLNRNADNIPAGSSYSIPTLYQNTESVVLNGKPSVGTAGQQLPAWGGGTSATDTDPFGNTGVLVAKQTTSNYGNIPTNYFEVAPGDVYVVQGWFKTGGAGDWKLYFTDIPGSPSIVDVAAPTAWTSFSYQFTVANAATKSQVEFANASATSDWIEIFGLSCRKVRGSDKEVADGTDYIRMPVPPAASAAASTSLTQSGTTTAISVGTSTFYFGKLTVTTNAGTVDPGAYGTYYVYADNPGWTGGTVTLQASTSNFDPSKSPYRLYFGQITTGSGGGGSGGGGFGCFSGDTRVKTTYGFKRFDELPHVPFEIVNRTGRHRAKLLVHPNSLEPMRRMGPHLVTDRHLMRVGDEWMPASLLFHERAPEELRTVYNLHVLSDDPEDHHYILENGLTAHNIKP